MFLKTCSVQNQLSMYCTGLESNLLPAVPHLVDETEESPLCLFKQCTIEVRSGVETVSTHTLISA